MTPDQMSSKERMEYLSKCRQEAVEALTSNETNSRTWALIITIAALVIALLLVDKRHTKNEEVLKRRIEALEAQVSHGKDVKQQ